MASTERHPSYLELDRLALGAAVALATREHTATCRRCRAHVEQIGDPQASLPRLASERPRRRARPGWVWLGATAIAAAALLLLVDRGGARPGGSAARYTTVKGGQAVGVYLRRGGQTLLWNGTDPVVPGDRLRLKIVPDGLGHVQVFTQEGGGAPLALYRGSIPTDRDTVLPAAWEVDDRGGEEVLIVVLSRRPLGEGEVRAAIAARQRDSDVWVAHLRLPKRSGAEALP